MNNAITLNLPDFSLVLRKIYIVEVSNPESAFLYDDAAFEQMFKTHFKALHAYANVTLRDEEQAEEIVQGVFIKLWEKRELLHIDTSVKAYLYRSVHNECLNHIKRNKVKARYEEHAINSGSNHTESAAKLLELKELEGRIQEALAELPQQCRIIFQMSRFEELKYKEIAEQLNLSVKTVENQMGKALKLMRVKLRDFLPLFLFWLDRML
jgi:RNA polymerase sigma-70 factor (ECF subfamily)